MDELDGQQPLFDLTDGQQVDEAIWDLKTQHHDLRKSNQSKVQELRKLGRQIDPGNVALVRLQCLAEMLFDEDALLQLDVATEARMSEVLDQAQASARRSSLLGGNGFGPNFQAGK